MQNNVIFLGCTNSYGHSFSACNTKVEFMSRGLSSQGDECYIHNGTNGTHGIKHPVYFKKENVGTVVDYPTKGNWYISPLFNHALLINDLKKWYRPDLCNWIVVEAPYLPYYYLNIRAARKTGYKVAVISHEWLGSFCNSNPIKKWCNHLYSKVFGYSVDAIFPISQYIIEKILKFKKPYLKVPVEADFSYIPDFSNKELYFLYCVSAEYIRVIDTVLKGFKKFSVFRDEYKMVLILSGCHSAIDDVYKLLVEQDLSDKVVVKHKIPYDELMNLNKKASGLIVPLNPDFEQDKARFSQKIAEYLASGTVLITNNVGEVGNYFEDKNNAVIVDYSSDGFYDSFKWIASNRDEAVKIGLRGFETGRKYFDYEVCGRQLHDFFIKTANQI